MTTTVTTTVHDPLDVEVLADGLGFPEGPCIAEDGTVYAVDIDHATIVEADGKGGATIVATPGGGPNGMALRADGTAVVANNGGFLWTQIGDFRIPIDRGDPHQRAARLREGLDRADRPGHRRRAPSCTTRATGGCSAAPTTSCSTRSAGSGSPTTARAVTTASTAAGSTTSRPTAARCSEIAFPLLGPNGVGLSPDGRTVYAAETHTGRLWAWALAEPGRGPAGRRLAGRPPRRGLPRRPRRSRSTRSPSRRTGASRSAPSATASWSITPDGSEIDVHPIPGDVTTNIAFGGADRRRAVDHAVPLGAPRRDDLAPARPRAATCRERPPRSTGSRHPGDSSLPHATANRHWCSAWRSGVMADRRVWRASSVHAVCRHVSDASPGAEAGIFARRRPSDPALPTASRTVFRRRAVLLDRSTPLGRAGLRTVRCRRTVVQHHPLARERARGIREVDSAAERHRRSRSPRTRPPVRTSIPRHVVRSRPGRHHLTRTTCSVGVLHPAEGIALHRWRTEGTACGPIVSGLESVTSSQRVGPFSERRAHGQLSECDGWDASLPLSQRFDDRRYLRFVALAGVRFEAEGVAPQQRDLVGDGVEVVVAPVVDEPQLGEAGDHRAEGERGDLGVDRRGWPRRPSGGGGWPARPGRRSASGAASGPR